MQFSPPSVALVSALLHMLLKALFRLIVVRPAQMLGIIGLLLLLLFTAHPQYWQKLAADEAWRYQSASNGMVLIERCEDRDFVVETPGGRDSRNCRNVEMPVSDQAEKSLKGIISFVNVLIILSFALEFLLFCLGKSTLIAFPVVKTATAQWRGGQDE